MRWNPISDSRRKSLLKWLRSYLSKAKKLEDLNWYVEQLDDFISWVDPSPGGAYSQWILLQLLTNKLNSSEDYDKTHNLLKDFHRIRLRLPKELQNIDQYGDFTALFRMVREYLPKTRTKKELQQAGQEIVYQDSVYTFTKIMNVEAAVSLSKNTGWCTCNKAVAANYLEESPLFIVYKNKEKFLLVHPARGEVRHDDNSTYDEYDPYLMEIFKTYLPDLWCPNHEPNGELRNKNLCHADCNTGGCCGDFKSCANCPNKLCRKCGEVCKTCGITFCADCIAEHCFEFSCEAPLCREHALECDDCGKAMCLDHRKSCDTCDVDVCYDCAEKCWQCNLWACKDHQFECTGCSEADGDKCVNCVAKDYGSSADDFDPKCHICESDFCFSCLQKCITCGKNTCDFCLDEDSDSYICKSCSEGDEEDEDEDDEDDEDY
jgi:hypothetical protein